ncbi:MAG: DUF1036 domain-containing protein, partial [Pseudomonadota bacterium]
MTAFIRSIATAKGALLVMLTFWTAEAHAELKLCNATPSRVGVAIGYQDSRGWATEGWWNISAQTCES